jgi:hypothetical protein
MEDHRSTVLERPLMKQNDAPAPAEPSTAALVRIRLQECLADLDRLELHHSAALVSMAIDQLGPAPTDPEPIG